MIELFERSFYNTALTRNRSALSTIHSCSYKVHAIISIVHKKCGLSTSPLKRNLTFRLQQEGIEIPKNVDGSRQGENIIDLLRNYISQELSKISHLHPNNIFSAIERSKNVKNGDLLIPIPKLCSKGDNARELAIQWSKNFPRNQILHEVKSNGHFLQFFISPSLLSNVLLPYILQSRDKYGSQFLEDRKTILIEFSSPNIAKPFHAGHLRSTIIGGFLSNLYEKRGWNVVRMNYLGDWGIQFGLLAVAYRKYGNEQLLKENPINHLFELYVSINKDRDNEKMQDKLVLGRTIDDEAREYFRKMEFGDPEALSLWEKFRKLSIESYVNTYRRLNIKYDVYSGESEVSKNSIEIALKSLLNKGCIYENKGAKIVDLSKHNEKMGRVLIQKSDGTTLYLTRDIGAAIDRYTNYKFDRMIYVIASQQDLYARQLFEILKLLQFPWADNLSHVNFGMVQGMSTRKGNVIFLSDILEEAKSRVLKIIRNDVNKLSKIEEPENVADSIGISAVIIQDLQSKRINNYKFQWERILSFEGDTGPYLQYAHSRLASIEKNMDISSFGKVQEIDFGLLREPEALELMKILAHYPDILSKSLKNHEPSIVVTYLFKLAHAISKCYDVLWVAGQPNDLARSRLSLYLAAKIVLNDGMKLLGITPVDRM
ncbi:hypothetical protein KAFR_0D04890 [Kazachstania africana CBS 2517]|uniref:arginine--tRNA ligase n=1 Tax=Kazachstania africana (strain ATCC 22294 / BCRC 22015 / CBS 2517 / CECT 1963 / NBRC 1671 / NRRL Y-8276) TaxID=1071382 RepID=H2AUT6_KAZAF|nr:hypothetical protein KAFR_0D04890 [Kazachstania africana CBS 2517]CCF58136.1 hypothetical protein KAFR_0D04890 [Kazachstania africana CBS 2517]